MPIASAGKSRTAGPRLKAPWPYIGGKGRVANLIWGHLGDVRNFIEPFCGSAAVLLGRPNEGRIETVNDVSHFIVNAWRAIRADPEGVARHADWPVTEADLHARHLWLMLSTTAAEFRTKIKADPDYFDPRIAGWWIWGQCTWIGAGWCGAGQSEKLPRLAGGREGDLYYGGIGVNAESRPQLADAFARGRGVHGNDHAGTCAEREAWLIGWMNRLADRLRNVRVCCGDWRRVCSSPSVTTRLGTTGIFLDPPYALDIERMHAWVAHLDGGGPEPDAAGKATNRDGNLYGSDKGGDVDRMVAEVHRYCREKGAHPDIRIVLAGYDGEHDPLEDLGWEAKAWKSSGYQNRGKGAAGNARERLWISPHCCLRETEVRPMFEIWDRNPAASGAAEGSDIDAIA